jgi:hypothetical protein
MSVLHDTHVPFDRLVDYWFGDMDDADIAIIDEHLMHCDSCGAQLESVALLAQGTRDAFAAGEVGAVVSADFVARLVERDVRVREYRVGPGGSVHCTVAPEDVVLISRLEAPLHGVGRLDLVAETPEGATEHFPDVPFDAASGELLLASRVARVRPLPAHDFRLRLFAVADTGRQEIAEYVFHHRPWQ